MLDEIAVIESEIDAAFAENELAKLPYAQCMWTLLSVVEEHNFKITVLNPLAERERRIYIDGLINALTYPMRVCHRKSARGNIPFQRRLVDEHYELANKWLDLAVDYDHFCAIFPLSHAKEIELHVQGDELIPTDWAQTDLSYEVYDRFILRRDPDTDVHWDPTPVLRELTASLRVNGGLFSVKFSPRLAEQLIRVCQSALSRSYTLPGHWKFTFFSIEQFRTIFICIQSLAYGWFLARRLAAQQGVHALGYASAVWTPKKSALLAMLTRYTGVEKPVVADVLQYLTFGEVSIRNPDIATQPIVDLSNEQYAISPFVLLNVHAERNLCVLLNQIPAERHLYSMLVDEKERLARAEVIESLTGLGLDFRFGEIKDTDVDLAILDRVAKKCLCVEIKWFIEPAEIREVIARSEELSKGVGQALKIAHAFKDADARLMSLLDVDHSYDFLSMVGSVNFIGGPGVQHPDVPITKLWHLITELRRRGSLGGVMDWLRNRQYLPKKDSDYKIVTVQIACGKWKSRWYGIAYA